MKLVCVIVGDPEAQHQPFFLRAFKLREIKKATQDFNEEWLLGQGGFGKVYRGSLKDPETGRTVLAAVKRLNPDSIQGQREWLVIFSTSRCSVCFEIMCFLLKATDLKGVASLRSWNSLFSLIPCRQKFRF